MTSFPRSARFSMSFTLLLAFSPACSSDDNGDSTSTPSGGSAGAASGGTPSAAGMGGGVTNGGASMGGSTSGGSTSGGSTSGGSTSGGSTSGGASTGGASTGGAAQGGTGGVSSAGQAGSAGAVQAGGGSGGAGGKGNAQAGATGNSGGAAGGAQAGTGGAGGGSAGASGGKSARASIMPVGTNTITGTATFTQVGAAVTLVIQVSNCPEGNHAVHLHELKDCGNNGLAAGNHWVPQGEVIRQIPCMANGMGTVSVTPDNGVWTIGSGASDVTRHSIMVHAGGDASPGDRIGCGLVNVQ